MLIVSCIVVNMRPDDYNTINIKQKLSMSGLNVPEISIAPPKIARQPGSEQLQKFFSFSKSQRLDESAPSKKPCVKLASPLSDFSSSKEETFSQSFNQSQNPIVHHPHYYISKLSKISQKLDRQDMQNSSEICQKPPKIFHEKQLVTSNLSSINLNASIEMGEDCESIRGTNLSPRNRFTNKNSKDTGNNQVRETKKGLASSCNTPTFDEKPQQNFPVSALRSKLSVKGQKNQQKVRLRDYLFMVNSSVEAASKKRTKQLQFNKSLYIEKSSFENISRCQSDLSIGSHNRYQSQKYKLNHQQITTFVKKDITQGILSLKAKLDQLQQIASNTSQDLNETEIAGMLDIKRFIEEANIKSNSLIGQSTTTKEKAKDSIVVVQVPQKEQLQAPPLIGTFHKQI